MHIQTLVSYSMQVVGHSIGKGEMIFLHKGKEAAISLLSWKDILENVMNVNSNLWWDDLFWGQLALLDLNT